MGVKLYVGFYRFLFALFILVKELLKSISIQWWWLDLKEIIKPTLLLDSEQIEMGIPMWSSDCACVGIFRSTLGVFSLSDFNECSSKLKTGNWHIELIQIQILSKGPPPPGCWTLTSNFGQREKSESTKGFFWQTSTWRIFFITKYWGHPLREIKILFFRTRQAEFDALEENGSFGAFPFWAGWISDACLCLVAPFNRFWELRIDYGR